MKAKYLVKGIVKSIPGIEFLYKFHKSTGGTCSARYCYSVWLRHLSYAYQNGIHAVPEKVAELGPGDSLGTGLAALISGAKKYYALDIVDYSNTAEENLKIFDELVVLFKEKTPIPGPQEFPLVKPLLDNYDFPAHIFNDEQLAYLLSDERILQIRNAIKQLGKDNTANADTIITYVVPWFGKTVIEENCLDMIFSQAVLQHIDDLEQTFTSMYKWLKPGGLISHEIDFGSMGSSDTWYGHWEYSNLEWDIVRGRKKFYINREPLSTYIALLKKYHFELLYQSKTAKQPISNRKKLAKRFHNLSDEDLNTATALVQAKKIPLS